MNDITSILMSLINSRNNPNQIINQIIQNNPNAQFILNQIKQSGLTPEQFAKQYARQFNIDLTPYENIIKNK